MLRETKILLFCKWGTGPQEYSNADVIVSIDIILLPDELDFIKASKKFAYDELMIYHVPYTVITLKFSTYSLVCCFFWSNLVCCHGVLP